MKTWTFRTTLAGVTGVWRTLELADNQTLEELHFAVQAAYGWSADHLYSFFMSGRAWDADSEYCPPESLGPWDPPAEEARSAEEQEDRLLLEELRDMSAERLRRFLEQVFERLQAYGEMSAEELQAWRLLSDAERLAFLDYLQDSVGHLLDNESGPGNARTTRLWELDLRLGKEFLYLFDYAREWRFHLFVTENDPAAPQADYPLLVEAVGQAPDQYGEEDRPGRRDPFDSEEGR